MVRNAGYPAPALCSDSHENYFLKYRSNLHKMHIFRGGITPLRLDVSRSAAALLISVAISTPDRHVYSLGVFAAFRGVFTLYTLYECVVYGFSTYHCIKQGLKGVTAAKAALGRNR